MEQDFVTEERYVEYRRAGHFPISYRSDPSASLLRRYPHAVRFPRYTTKDNTDPRKRWLYDTQPTSRWCTLDVEQRITINRDGQLYETRMTLREYRFVFEADALLFQLRWMNQND